MGPTCTIAAAAELMFMHVWRSGVCYCEFSDALFFSPVGVACGCAARLFPRYKVSVDA